MSSTMRKVALAAGLMLVGAASTARAGTSTIFEGNIPVPFVIRGVIFPAGRYMVERESSSSILLIRGEKHNHLTAFLAAQPDGGPDPAGNGPVLVLKQIEGQYQLTSVWESPGEGWDVKEAQ
jgi:hypothetical protein